MHAPDLNIKNQHTIFSLTIEVYEYVQAISIYQSMYLVIAQLSLCKILHLKFITLAILIKLTALYAS